MSLRFIVTGGRGFIGSHFVEKVLQEGHEVYDIDKMTYCSSDVLPWDNHEKYTFIREDILTISHLPSADILVNFAAESHVDNSFSSPSVFSRTNYNGVQNLLDLTRTRVYDRPFFVQISTDEVYGDREEYCVESSNLLPGNPYSASKSAAEMLVLAYSKTYNIDYLITRSGNNYGLRQYEEKLIPKIISCIENNRKIPIHGDGTYTRDWVYVKDNVNAIYHLIMSGYKNETYNISTKNYLTNLEVVKEVLGWYGEKDFKKYIKFVENRLSQDLRYHVNSDKLLETGWSFQYNKSGLHKFIE